MNVIGTATPLFMVGDCHSLVFSDLIVEDAGRRYVTRSKFTRGTTAQGFSDANGVPFAGLVDALVSELLVTRKGDGLVANHRIFDNDTLPEGIARERTRTSPVLCVFAGEFDVRNSFLPGMRGLDFELPSDEESGEPLGEFVPYAVVRSRAERLLEPLLRGMRTLAGLGFTNLYLHSIPPPTVDDDTFEQLHAFRAPAALRYKSVRLFNAILADFAQTDSGVRFLDVWPALTTAGRLDPAYALDGLHLNRRAATHTIERILTDLTRRTQRFDAERYRTAALAARAAFEASAAPVPEIAARYRAEGIVRLDLGAEYAAQLRALIGFGLDAASPPPGWAHDPLEPSLTFRPRPTRELVAELARLLALPDVNGVLTACCGFPPSILNARVFRSVAHEQRLDGPRSEQFAAVDFPPEVMRGVLYLNDVADANGGPVVIRTADGAGMVLGPAGTLILFDPHRIATVPPASIPAQADNLDLLFGPSPGARRVVAAPGDALWPIDPSNVELDGALCAEC